MENNRLEKIIENSIKNASMEVEVRKPVMARIEDYEMKKAKRPGILTILIYIYALGATLVSIIFFDRVVVYFKPFLQQFPTGVSFMEVVLQGVFISMLAFLVILGVYSWRSPASRGRRTDIAS
jgi:hypothetical protein